MMIKRYWSVIIVVFAALVMGSLSSAAWVSQEPERSLISEEERKRVLERLTKQFQDAQQGVKQPPVVAAPQQIPPAQPAASAATPTPAPGNVQRESGKMQLNTENAELYDFITQIAGTLGLTPIVIDPEIKGTVNIMSSAPMSKEDVPALFNLILKNNNAALIKQGDIYQIVPVSSALKKGVEIIEHLPPVPAAKPEPEKAPAKKPNAAPQTGTEPSNPPASSAATSSAAATQAAPKAAQAPDAGITKTPHLATHVIRAEFVPVRDLIEPLKLFMTEGGVIMPYERLNMLILTDYSDSAARVLQIIRMLDNSFLDPDLIDLIKINNNASADVLDDLKKIFGSGAKDSTTGISFVSLDRINAIFVIASSKRGLEEVKRWIKQLDATTGRNIQTYVYIVENSTASNIAMMLSALYGGEGTGVSGGAGTSGGTAGGAYGGRSSQTGGGLGGGALGGTGSSIGGAGSQGTATSGLFGTSSSYQSGGSLGGYQSGYQGGFQGGYQGGYMGGSTFGAGQQLGPRLNANPTVSAQVLRGGAFTGLQDTVRMVVDDINNSLIIQATSADYAFILETIKKMDVLPRQAIIDARIFEVDLTDALSFGISGMLQARTSDTHATTGKIDGTTGTLSASTFAFIGDSREILMNLNALREKTKVRILEAPSVLALDGMMARIVVGSEIPYPGASYYAAAGGSTTSVQYRDTGISLIVVPRISASGSVTLQITQEVSSPGAQTAQGPTFAKTDVETTLSVKDGETVAIAGLIRDSNSFSRSGVPFLSQIPLLGSLFGQTNKNAARTELIILITPHVIRTPEKFQEMTQELKDSLRHVRKLVDQKEDEHIGDMEDAREERYKREQKNLKRAEPSKPEAQPGQPSTQPALPPKDKQTE